ncbi:hypothetical protein PMAYCL1PPCAC_00510, partial [Pristionchus mayeri]
RAGFSQIECFHRHRCKQCRLALCFAAGMSSESVQIEYSEDDISGREKEIALLPHPPQIECQMDKMMQSLLALEDAHDRLR